MADKKELYFHIGTVKTGTTALQRFLASKRDALRKKGIIYPINPDGSAAHHRLSWSFQAKAKKRRLDWPDDLKEPQEEWEFVLKQLTSDKGLITSEDFLWIPPEAVPEVRKFTSELQVKLIVYWRQRDDLENSWYNQLVKRGAISTLPSYRTGLTSKKHLALWAKVFGKENVILRPYERCQLYQGNVLADFLHHVFGLEPKDEFTLPEEKANTRLHRVVLEYKRQVNHLPILLLQNRKVVNPLRSASDMLSEKGRKDYPVFSPRQRLELIKEYKKENAAIAREFLGRKDGKLFYDSLPDLDEDWQPYDELLEEDARTINGYLAENHPDEFEIIVKGILGAQYMRSEPVRQAALRLLPGIPVSHISTVLTRNLQAGANKDIVTMSKIRLGQIYSSRTWKAGMMLKRIYNKLPSCLQRMSLAIARSIYRKI